MKVRTICLILCLVGTACQKPPELPKLSETAPKKDFENKVRCSEIADKKTKTRFEPNTLSGYSKVIYSKKRNSCVAAALTTTDIVFLYSVEDLLTSETLWSEMCRIKSCDKIAAIQEKQQQVMKDLE
jgi:hypothetical protein